MSGRFPWLADRRGLAAILLVAAILRMGVTMGASVHHADEIFQYLEQAHRLVFGYGYVPWEYRAGMRSWLVPLLLAGPMALGDRLAPQSDLYLLLPRLAVALATLGTVWGAWRLGRNVGPIHAVLTALVAGIWFEQVYYASHTLTETLSWALAVPGLALLFTAQGRRGLIGAGALLAAAAVVRFHYAPALAVAVIWRSRLDIRGAWAPVLLGATLALGVSGAVDLAMGQMPFAWIVENFRHNVLQDAASRYGVSDWHYYLRGYRAWWRWAFLPIVFLAVLGARRYPALLAVALVTIALHMLIGHKEERFVLLASTLLVLLAAIGTADLPLFAKRGPRRPMVLLAVAAAMWAAVSIALAASGAMRLRWSDGAPALAAARAAGRQGTCGVATWHMRFWQTGGYTYLHRDVPIYPLSAQDELYTPFVSREGLRQIVPAFDTFITTADGADDVPPGYRRTGCHTFPAAAASAAERAGALVCAYRRAGGCDPAAGFPWRLR